MQSRKSLGQELRRWRKWRRLSTVCLEDGSLEMRSVVRRQAWRTVVWSRPPKCLPIAGRDSSVSSRARYMATWRGHATRLARALERSSSGESWKCVQAAALMSAIEHPPGVVCG